MRAVQESATSPAPAEQEPHAPQTSAPQAESADPAHPVPATDADPHQDGPAAPKPMTIDDALKHFLNPEHLYEHVMDSDYIELPELLGGKLPIPNPLGYTEEHPMVAYPVAGKPLLTGQFTKFMALESVAAIVLLITFVLVARKTKTDRGPRGRLINMLEAVVIFIRDEIAKPAIGSKDAYRFLPFLLTLFFFILTLNLIGMLPWLGSVTGSISVTAVLAICTFIVVLGSGIKKMGLIQFFKAQVPHMELPKIMSFWLVPMIWAIEVFGLCVKHFVLAIRLFANMFGGHLVLAAFLAFIGVASTAGILGWGISLGSIAMSICFSLLELLVAFLQAYIFTFLAALFIGSAQHAH